MKRKEKSIGKDSAAPDQSGKIDQQEELEERAEHPQEEVFLLENGKLTPFKVEEYTASILYQKVEAFSVECKLVRPEEAATLLYEGRKPTRKTVPIIVAKNDDCLLLESWEDLESRPERLADVREVIGAVPVKQVFVLKRKQG